MPSDQAQTPIPANPSDPSGTDWLYNELMRHVEADLMTDRMERSVRQREGESSEDYAKRMRHYEDAKEVFAAVARDVGEMLERDGTLAHQEYKRLRTQQERQADQGSVQHIEDILDNPAA